MKTLIISELKKIIKEIRNKDVELDENTNLEEDLALDSLDSVEILLSLEEVFNIDISETEMKSIKTVGDLIELILKHKENQNDSTINRASSKD